MQIRKIKSLLILALLLCTLSTYAQKTDWGNWFIYFGNQKINKKLNWWNEVQYRNYDFMGDLQQLLLRTGIGYNLSENNNNVLLGYAYIKSERYLPNTDTKVNSDENRIYQQFITRQSFARTIIQHRYRIEERFLSDDFQMRFRYFLSFNIPLNHNTMRDNTVYLSAYNEVMLNAKKPLFDRNRLYGALGYVINNNFKVEAGIMAQTQENNNRNQFQIVFFNNIPLSNQ